ncbi:MAG: transposase, partial [Bacillota bacterium]|nr:transposase [Bacillota bacterium]
MKDKQKNEKQTRKQSILLQKRNHRVDDYLSKSARIIMDYCIKNDIGTLVVGKNGDFQKEANLGKVNNQ